MNRSQTVILKCKPYTVLLGQEHELKLISNHCVKSNENQILNLFVGVRLLIAS